MDKHIIDWLLEGPAWLQYAVKLQLLNSQPDVQSILKDKVVGEIIARLKDAHQGISAIKSGFFTSDEYGNPYWDLFFLADLGLTADDLNLKKEINDFLDSQNKEGLFITEFGMGPTYFCKSAILISSVIKMGFGDDARVKKSIQYLLASQRLDGGWYCNPNHDIGSPLQHEPSCPQDNLNILLLLGQYAEYRNDNRFKGAIDLLLDHWDMRNTGQQIVYFGVGRRYQSLRYPATRYGILRVLDAISLFPCSMKRASFHSMLEFVHSKARDGKYYVEMPSPYTDLEPAGQPNRLITFIINRIDKKVEENKL